jgi:methylmalonyl-CoA/ethylmalonyl-CoA epimerase
MLEGVHHINFLVADLDTAVARYKELFGIQHMEVESLPDRGVRTARFDMNGVWIVLVQPTEEESEPMKHLRQHGEGLYLVSFCVAELAVAAEELVEKGAINASAKPRTGLQGWQVIDLDTKAVFGAQIQLTQDSQ